MAPPSIYPSLIPHAPVPIVQGAKVMSPLSFVHLRQQGKRQKGKGIEEREERKRNCTKEERERCQEQGREAR